MSNYTTELRWIMEQISINNGDGSYADGRTIQEIIASARPVIFNWNYTIDEDADIDTIHKQLLETKFLHHYYFQEIAFETVALWQDRLQERWMYLLPKYKELWKAVASNTMKWYENFSRHRVVEESISGSTEGSNTGTSETSNSNSTTTKNRFSDTPQGGTNGVEIENNLYLTNAAIDNREYEGSYETSNSNSNESSSTSDRGEEETVTGFNGKPLIEVFNYFKDNVFDTDELFLDDLSDLFMGVW